jgi:hypothetical protein
VVPHLLVGTVDLAANFCQETSVSLQERMCHSGLGGLAGRLEEPDRVPLSREEGDEGEGPLLSN